MEQAQQQDSKSPRSFKVIVVGGGLVGLTAAHILSSANIDFTLLEQHEDLLPKIGSLIVFIPSTIRIFRQLGILEELRPHLFKVEDYVTIDAINGSFLHVAKDVGGMWERNHGSGLSCMSRADFTNVLYRTLPDAAKARIHLKKRVSDINVHPDGVSVHCEDGTVEDGSLVIGADGVHSRARQCMNKEAIPPSANKPPQAPEQSPYISTYRCLIGNTPSLPGLKPNTVYLAASQGVSIQLITSSADQGSAWWYLYEALQQPTRQRHRYTDKQKAETLDKYSDLHVVLGYQVRDLLTLNIGDVGMFNQEEGRVARWTQGGRIALVGDAIRKLNPHAGIGYNRGAGDVVELLNRVHRLLRTAPDGIVTTQMLRDGFGQYEKTRGRYETDAHLVSRLSVRNTAWLEWRHRLMGKWVMRFLPVTRWMLNFILAPVVAREPVIEWLEETELPQGARRWVHHPIPKVTEA